MGLTSFLTSFVLFSVIELSYIVVCGKLQIVVIHDNFHQCNFSHKVVTSLKTPYQCSATSDVVSAVMSNVYLNSGSRCAKSLYAACSQSTS